jgi:hypothetical protein
MLTESITLPFRFPEVFHGFAEGGGVVRMTHDALVLEFQVRDGFLGFFRSGIHELPLAFESMASVTLKKGWFTTRITIRAKSLKALQDLPVAENGDLVLKIARKDRALAEQLVSHLDLRLCELDLKRMTSQLESGADSMKS